MFSLKKIETSFVSQNIKSSYFLSIYLNGSKFKNKTKVAKHACRLVCLKDKSSYPQS